MTTQQKRKRFIAVLNIILMILCITGDRALKIYSSKKLKNHPNKPIINGILELRYLENSGAAFGLLDGQKSFFILVAIIILFAIFYAMINMPGKRRFYPANIALSLIAAGAIGNLIDRIIYSYVIDIIYFSIIRFPIFNLADFFVTVGTVFLLLLILFLYKEDDLDFLKFKEKKIREMDK